MRREEEAAIRGAGATASVTKTASVFRENLSTRHGGGNTVKYTIVYGALRSGSTMLRLMLDGHSRLSCDGEHDFLFDYLHRTGHGWTCDLENLRHDRIFNDRGIDLPDTEDGEAALAQLLSQIAARGGKERTVLMLHRGLDKAVELLPGVPVIHLLRDPRDVARSWVGMGWHANAYCAAEGWMAAETLWEKVAAGQGVHALELRYEDLLADPEGELGRVCAFLGTGFDPAMLSYPDHTTYEAPDPGLAWQWRRKMPAKDLRLVETRLGGLLALRGYEPSGEPPIAPTRLQKTWLHLQNAHGRWRHMIGRYGVLPIYRTLGRRLKIKPLQRHAQRRIDQIQRKHLR